MPSTQTLYERNTAKLLELLPEVQPAALGWLRECHSLGIEFKVLEAYRTQERQNALYQQGRTKPGDIVTHTTTSNHTRRLAVDVLPLKGTYEDIADVGRKYGITHPFTKGFVDLPHFEFDKVVKPEPIIDPKAEIRRIERLMSKTDDPGTLKSLQAKKERLQRRIS